MTRTPESSQSADDIRDVVLAATGSENVSIANMLEAVAKRFDAFGCGLWEVTPFVVSENRKRPIPDKFITVAAWWRGGLRFAMDDVPIKGSPTGEAASTGVAKCVPDIQDPKQGGPKSGERFWADHDIRPMCVAQVHFVDGSLGAINVYRSGRDNLFTEAEKLRLVAIAAVIPGLYRAVREKIELRLVKDVSLELKHKNINRISLTADKKGKALTGKQVEHSLAETCKMVARAFSCVEVSIFLENRDEPGHYSLAATSDIRCVKERRYKMESDTQSLTEHVLHMWQEITVPDMTKIEQYKDWLRVNYDFEKLAPIEHYTVHARKVLGLRKKDYLPPMTFVALPIFGEGEWYFSNDLCGVIRCYGAQQGPYYFENRDVEVLRVVAQLIGKWWSAWRTRTELEQENKSWKKVVGQLDRMNQFTLGVLNGPQDGREALLEEGLRVVEEVLPGAELNGYRLIDKDTNRLVFGMFGAKAQAHLRSKGKCVNDLQSFLDKDKKHWGQKVFETGETLVIPNLCKRRDWVPIFADTTGIIITPVGVGEKRFGVLDLRWTKEDIPPHAHAAAVLIGQQIGVCLHLNELVAEVRRRQKDAEAAEIQQKRIYEDFSHQLKSPLHLARIRIEDAVRLHPEMQAPQQLLVARGLVRRVHRVATNMRMISAISKGENLDLNLHPIDKSQLIKMLIEIAIDTGFQYANQVRFAVDRESIQRLDLKAYRYDRESVEHTIANLFDNAAKYSKRASVVKVFGGISGSNRFYIAVANQGIPILPDEMEDIATRGWRSRAARGLGLDGQGIGLWLSRELLRPQNAELQIFPRNQDGVTEFRIAFFPFINRLPL